MIRTPPEGRVPVLTYVHAYDEEIAAAAIERELSRGGQVFYIQNRIERFPEVLERLSRLAPAAGISVMHGRLGPAVLERTMLRFLRGEGGILVATSIVELGLDLPNVNTLIVEDAERFGLAELYQLRGRVGRSTRQAYAYFTYQKKAALSPLARERLSAVSQAHEWGAGFRIAMKDMELRGAGNLLGAEQHGFVAAVGVELYSQLLAEALDELKGETREPEPDPVLSLRVDAYLPDEPHAGDTNKLLIYRELSTIDSLAALGTLKDHLADRYGSVLPDPVEHLCQIVEIKLLARAAGVIRVEEPEIGELRLLLKSGARHTLRTGSAWVDRYQRVRSWLASRVKGEV